MELLGNIEAWQYIVYFFIYSFIGWIIEVAYHAFTCGKFINRGFLAGMVCPIYGFGAVIIIFLLNPVKDNLLYLFIGAVLICTILEYLAGLVLDKLFHKRWWDYSDVPFNIGGYVCIQFSVYWGIGGIFLVREIHSIIQNIVGIIDVKILILISIISIVSILIDVLASVQNVLKFNKKLELLNDMQLQIYDLSNFVGEGVSDKTLDIINKVDPVIKDISDKKTAIGEVVDKELADMKDKRDNIGFAIDRELNGFKDKKLEAQLKLEELVKKKEELFNNFRNGEKRIIKAFPKLKENMYDDAFEEFRRALKNKLSIK